MSHRIILLAWTCEPSAECGAATHPNSIPVNDMAHDIVVKVGQVWFNSNYPGETYEIVEIIREDHYDRYGYRTSYHRALANRYDEGKLVYRRGQFGPLTSDLKPYGWALGWECASAMKKFSYISRRSLRKRMREQMAGSLLTDKS